MENNIIVVVNSWNSDWNAWNKTLQNIESIRWAAQRWNVDYHELTYNRYLKDIETIKVRSGKTIFQRIAIWKTFCQYDKILYIDADTIINTTAPNIFDELTDEYDICGVLDGNPGRNDDLMNFSRYISSNNQALEAFSTIEGFNDKIYFDYYINGGVWLGRGSLAKEFSKLKDEILNNSIIHDFVYGSDGHQDQNLLNAWFSRFYKKIKILDNEWNWIAPDIDFEYDKYLGDMEPYIYHFCGTNLAKERMKTYEKWKPE